ncbi:mitochondrial carrier domain-containing protein [Neurospora crassa]|nr:mitochondrial carrier domain-containing protein [Neurospora crassa]KAK3485087.1 mitochondrial carrier domain-containing protein [Neurospora crassa]KAK3493217.1 mitochondrial carrier domain-containing protein [Neurospora crassa]
MASQSSPPPFQTALLAGALAGTTVDLSLFPLDTLKTRLQSAQGFFASGGFRGIYRGVGSCVIGSAPGAAFFFVTYETTKGFLSTKTGSTTTTTTTHTGDTNKGQGKKGLSPGVQHGIAASLGEIAACAVRVPTEVIKQRAQAGQHGGSSLSSLLHILHQRSTIGLTGVWRELYRGWGITVMREVPFTVLQFPLWESLKKWGRERRQRTGRGLFGDSATGKDDKDVSAPESALYGSLAGGFAAALTTPLDVLKTRIMLSERREGVVSLIKTVWRDGKTKTGSGIRPFFSGIGPRVMWISIGGAIFLGSYQSVANAFEGTTRKKSTGGELSL